ncbi:MAG: chromosomal replication initiation protein [Chlamydiae bacterium SM23_39]|nr:MAG: chromosomal replication initiation protein [Chlamydiae bacterium SM23_39]
MSTCTSYDQWLQFLDFIKKQCSAIEFQNWFSPIKFLNSTDESIELEVPNIFVREYLLDNYKETLSLFFPKKNNGDLAINFVISESQKRTKCSFKIIQKPKLEFNRQYTFENFIEGPSNQFVKSAAVGVANRPGKSFNPLFIHGFVGLGKTHLLHGIGHYIQKNHKKIKTKYITTEAFINDLVNNLRNKSVDKMKNFYRNLDVFLIDDIQFLQNRLNFEEEFCNTFESLINQNKQIVISSDKPPSQLKLSDRMIARMECGLVTYLEMPELETRVAIIQHKAQQKKINIPNNVAFFIAQHIYNNIRQLEGAVNRLGAYCKLMNLEITEALAENLLSEMFEYKPQTKISVESILKSVSNVFEIKISEIKGESRKKEIALARQVAMYLAKDLIDESLMKIASSFGGKTHSTLLHAWKKISEKIKIDNTLQKQIQIIKKNLEK